MNSLIFSWFVFAIIVNWGSKLIFMIESMFGNNLSPEVEKLIIKPDVPCTICNDALGA